MTAPITALRLIRLCRGQTLETVAAATDSNRGWLSSTERNPGLAGRKLIRRLERFHSAKWSSLSKLVDGERIAAAILRSLEQN